MQTQTGFEFKAVSLGILYSQGGRGKANSASPRGAHRVSFQLMSDHDKEKALAQVSDGQKPKLIVIRNKSVKSGLFSFCLNGTNLRRKQCVATGIIPAGFLYFWCLLATAGTTNCMGDESGFQILPPCVSMEPVKCRFGSACKEIERDLKWTLLK